MATDSPASARLVVGRYAIYDEIASGGMATVHFGRLLGPVGFSRTVAIKRLHAHLAKDPELVAMFLDEARVAARIRHPNVVSTLDVVNGDGEIFLVMEYVDGESLARIGRALRERGERVPVPIASAIISGVLQGLHAAHEATSDRGERLDIVHRDVSPQNVLVGRDGRAHVLDFGVAKAAGRVQTTREGQLKGKLAYMAPELVRGARPTRVADVYSAGVVAWELLAGERLFAGDNEGTVLERVLFGEVPTPSARGAASPAALDDVVMRALARDPASRFATARDMARAVEAAAPVAPVSEVSEWVEHLVGDALAQRHRRVGEIESAADEHTGTRLRGVVRALAVEHGGDAATSPPASSRRRAWPWVVAIGVVLLLLAAIVFLRGGAWQAAPAYGPATSAPPSVAPAASSATNAVAQDTPVPPSPQTSAAASSASSGKSPAPKSPIVRDLSGTGSGTAKPKPKANCNPPYVIDSEGMKQYKLECL
jgi:serine/threonine-protein kinase